MRKLLVWCFALLFSAASAADEPVYRSFFGDEAIDGYDTVAYWTDSQAIEGKKEFTYEYKGAKWRFASQSNMQLFIADPEKYLPEYGGYCAWAMADDRLASVDGEAWTLFDGKLYLNYNKSVMEDWREQKALFVEQGNGFYKERFPEQAQSAWY
ncbi:YHS domain-containing (seleno)protein [Planctobacterium marinum]|uniref:YHS domain-containing (seleno)protein n=1 Tax=Planctobacterium marinum TaxID=1631968 RepID=UPI001E4BC84F|nr:YHS domain-containing (seleno)protein [Planctobacterium marinum]MCC2606343.1 YHS domain-containing protein [Planctobacterium marinum]